MLSVGNGKQMMMLVVKLFQGWNMAQTNWH